MRRSLSGFLLTCVAALAATAGPRATPASAARLLVLGTGAADVGSRGALPAGFTAAVDLATSARFVRVVANDIDRDGDLDVVASVGTLELLVWENDGAGHFSRRSSSTHRELRALPPAPAAERDGLASNRWIQQDDHRDADRDRLDARTHIGPASTLFTTTRGASGRFGPRVRSSRAPPI